MTQRSIARELGAVTLLGKHREKLPLFKQTVETVTEDRIAFVVRRIERALEDCSAEGIPLERWRLIRKAGLERVGEWPEIEWALDQALPVEDIHERPILDKRLFDVFEGLHTSFRNDFGEMTGLFVALRYSTYLRFK